MRRHLLGIIALLLMVLGLGGYFHITGSIVEKSNASAVLFRAGLLLGALWLALPQLATIPPWIMGAVLVGGIIIILQPKLLIIVAIALVVAWVLKYLSRFFFPK